MSLPSPSDRAAMAEQAGLGDQYLYQCLTGRKAMNAKQAVRVEKVLGGRLRRWHLRPLDWHETWPELIGADGAPPLPASDDGAADAQ